MIDPYINLIPINFYEDIRAAIDLSNDAKTQITRIFQEVLTNIHKRANAQNINIYLRHTDDWLAIKIEDNGKGILKHNTKGLGLKNIEIRTQYLKGKYKVKSAPNRGTLFYIFNSF